MSWRLSSMGFISTARVSVFLALCSLSSVTTSALEISSNASAFHRFVPPGHSLPELNVPDVRPGLRDRTGGLKLAERNKVFHFVQLDHSPLGWADQTLRIAVGFQEYWTPGDYYAFFPNGTETEPGIAIAFFSTIRVKFGRPFKNDTDGTLRSINHPSYTLRQEEEYVVVTKGDDRRWYFRSPDGGETWRLEKLELIRHPGMFTTLVYEDGYVVEIRFPNDEVAKVAYRFGLPYIIETPFGERVEIERGQKGFISRISIHRILDGSDEVNPNDSITFRYERDSEGKITRFVNDFDQEYQVQYLREEVVEDQTPRVIYNSIVQHNASNTIYARRHEARSSGEWIFTDRIASGEDFQPR